MRHQRIQGTKKLGTFLGETCGCIKWMRERKGRREPRLTPKSPVWVMVDGAVLRFFLDSSPWDTANWDSLSPSFSAPWWFRKKSADTCLLGFWEERVIFTECQAQGRQTLTDILINKLRVIGNQKNISNETLFLVLLDSVGIEWGSPGPNKC